MGYKASYTLVGKRSKYHLKNKNNIKNESYQQQNESSSTTSSMSKYSLIYKKYKKLYFSLLSHHRTHPQISSTINHIFTHPHSSSIISSQSSRELQLIDIDKLFSFNSGIIQRKSKQNQQRIKVMRMVAENEGGYKGEDDNRERRGNLFMNFININRNNNVWNDGNNVRARFIRIDHEGNMDRNHLVNDNENININANNINQNNPTQRNLLSIIRLVAAARLHYIRQQYNQNNNQIQLALQPEIRNNNNIQQQQSNN